MSKTLCLAISHPFHAAHGVLALQAFLHRFLNQCTKPPTEEIGYYFQWRTIPSRQRCYNVVQCNTAWCSFVQFSPGPVALIPSTETSCQEGGLLRQKKSLTRLQLGGRQQKKSSTHLHLGEGQVELLVPQGKIMLQILQSGRDLWAAATRPSFGP